MSYQKRESYPTLGDYVAAKGMKKNRVAAQLGVRPQVFSCLLNPEIYQPKVDDDLAKRIAELLNQPVEHVRQLYPKAA
jgi:hypothetical protein